MREEKERAKTKPRLPNQIFAVPQEEKAGRKKILTLNQPWKLGTNQKLSTHRDIFPFLRNFCLKLFLRLPLQFAHLNLIFQP